ncbi:MAG: glycosyltransferase family 39 protein [Armatimonadota bacterium]|nr:glycosyltransferase family 39 protein [Armatimonadota bacterium]MDW8155794.1 glycosyltransferase family 39 protein [Armatimonadota bacterium]
MDRSGRALLVAGLAVAAVWLVTSGRSLWFDELFALYAARRPWPEFVRFLHDHDAHPPAYYLLLRAWVDVFGSSERAARAPSALLAVAVLVAVRGLARERVGDQSAALAVVALAAAPVFLQASTEATRYMLLTLLYVAAGRESLRLLGDRAASPWRLAVLGALLLYTHYLGVVLVGSLGVFALWQGGWRGLRKVGAALVASAVSFVPWFPVLWHHMSSGRFDPPWRPPLPATLPLQVLHVVGFGGRVAGTASYFSTSSAHALVEAALAVPVAALLGIGLWTLGRRSAASGRLVACCAGLPALVLLGASLARGSMLAYPRYFVFAVPFLAVGVGALVEGRPPRPARVLAGLSAAAVLGLAVASLAAWASNPTEGMGDRRALAQALRERIRAQDVVLVYPRWELPGVDYYLPELRGRYVALRSEWTPEASSALREQVQRAAARADRLWVVQGFPISSEAFAATYRQLARTHRVAYFGDFDGVRLTLFVRR